MAGKTSVRWTEEENELLRANYSLLSIEKLILMFPGRTLDAIQIKAGKLNLTKKAKYWTNKELELLKCNYSYLTNAELLKLLPNRTKLAIQHQASNLNLIERSFNQNVFAIPNNLNSYYAGFIAADGCVTDRNKLIISLQESDNNFLKKFNTFMQCSREVRHYKTNSRFKPKYYCSLQYGSQKLADDLKNNFLIKPRKTLNVPFPKHLSFDNKISYIVGNLDGDGSICKDKRCFRIIWLGDFKFLNYIRNLFFKLGWIKNNTMYLNKMRDSGLYQLRFSGSQTRIIYCKLMRHIEKHQLPVLERKWNKKIPGYISLKRIEEMKKELVENSK